MSINQRLWIPAALCLGLAIAEAHGQESINTPGATQPAVGSSIVRSGLRLTVYDDDAEGNRITDLTLSTSVLVGILRGVSLDVSVPFTARHGAGDGIDAESSRTGLGDVSIGARWRIWQYDTSSVDTARVGLFAGLETPTGADEFTSDSFDPTIGAALTLISGRHGFNQALSWKFTTGANDDPVGPGESLADLLRFDSAYLYRLAPAAYSETLSAATYLVAELNGVYETNSDTAVLLSPGVLYEAPTFAVEFGVQIPVAQWVDERRELVVSVVFGVRVLF